MPLLIDGHNLIAQIPGLSLADEGDEAELVLLLRRYTTAKRGRQAVVVFDRGVYGHPQRLDGYGITCSFARSPQDADEQLIRRLGTLKRQAQKAERYKRYRSELSDLELWMASHRFLELRATTRVLEGRRIELDRQVDDLRTEQAACDARLEAERAGLRELDDLLSSRQQVLYDLENRIQLIEQDRKFKRQEQEGSRRGSEAARTERDVVERGLVALEQELAEVLARQQELQAA